MRTIRFVLAVTVFALLCAIKPPVQHTQAESPVHLDNVQTTSATVVESVVPQPVNNEQQALPAPAAVPEQKQPLNSKEELMTAAGIPESDWTHADYIISAESSWRHTIWNTSGSGAYGLCQSLPASKMASHGTDYKSNPVTQLRWCNDYAQARYGGWRQARAFWVVNKWW